MFRHSSAWVPIGLTSLILVMMCLYLLDIIPPEPTEDEGIGAHLFQLWMVLEFFSIIFFALKWITIEPRETGKVLALQIAFALVPLTIVFSQGW